MAKKQLKTKEAMESLDIQKNKTRKSNSTRPVKAVKPKNTGTTRKSVRSKAADLVSISLLDVQAEPAFQNSIPVQPKTSINEEPATEVVLDEKPVKKTRKTATKSAVEVKAKPKPNRPPVQKKIFVLDTSVILYNHNSINSFEENDVAIPITVLEELDNFKKGNDNKNFEAREFIRILDALSDDATLTDWIPLVKSKGGSFKVVMNEHADLDARKIFDDNKPDHRILNAALALTQEFPDRKVVLVSKDINLRLKAKSLNLTAEDFLTGKVKDVEGLYTGITSINGLPGKVIDKLYKQGYCSAREIGVKDPIANHYYVLKNTTTSALAFYNSQTRRVERLEKRASYRITPRNAEQVFAMHAILNPEVKLVTLQGVAGTGKTLLALAAAMEQRRSFKQIFLARPIVPLSNKDIGFKCMLYCG